MKKIRLVDVFIFIQKFMKSAIAAYSGQTAFFLMLSFFPFLMYIFVFTPSAHSFFQIYTTLISVHQFIHHFPKKL